MSNMYLHVLMPPLLAYMCYYPKCLKTIRMNGLKSRAAGRHTLSNSPTGKWENVAWAPLFRTECKWMSQGTQVYPPYSLHVPSLPLLHIHMTGLQSFLQHPFPSAHSDLCCLQQNDITKAQSESWAGDTEAQTGWI